MTWALSFFVAARQAIRSKKIIFSSNEDEILGRLNKQIKFIISFFINNVIDTQNGLGWGYVNGCNEPSLFFTYSVLEAYSDFEDNVLIGDIDEELLNYLNDGIDDESKRLEVRYRDLCCRVGDRTWEIYKPFLKTSFFSDKFDGTVNLITREEILNSSRSSALFNTIYVIFILFYSWQNTRKTGAERSEVINTMTRGLQLVQNTYDDFKSLGNDSVVDRHIISFGQKVADDDEMSKILNEESIQASTLLPMLVKANNLIAYWILRFPQQSMTNLFDEILLSKMDDKWLWENRKFDLLSTERYIEAIADFFDYYDTYERKYAEKQRSESEMKAELRAKIQKEVEEKSQKEFNKRIKEEEKNLQKTIRSQMEDAIRSEYTIEPQIDRKIELIAGEMVETKMLCFLQNCFSALAAYNRAGDDEKPELTEQQLAFRKMINEFFASYLFDTPKFRGAAGNFGVTGVKVKDSTLKDLQEFRDSYNLFIAKHCEQKGEKAKLSDIFDLIEKKNL